MRMASPVAMAVFYLFLGIVLVYLATMQVGANGWTFFSFFIIAFAAFDFYVGIRFLRMRKMIKQMQDKDQK
ncbi:DUF4305 domain-containing protein [Alkalicoccobacillus porphyridii]|uniref:DUF4305 domain-containing protein n=1 Tax=Alkalicoccobacillus porphyridii TaxID=2597270 RepID=A0A553ZTZ2_9BACI|nr:DUF4305 domain-containing protein [Alkalicoccobacillus porphyridii]TSB44924.1 DUF4305 domain-containing protein [Alkalicoccobacillus porphyridii]